MVGRHLSLLKIATQTDCLPYFIWVLKMSLRFTLIQKGGLCSLRLLPLMTVLWVYAPSGHSTRKQLARGRFFEGIQNYMENKNEGNENKIILDPMGRDGRNKTLHRYPFNHALSKLIMDNRLEDLYRLENPDSSEFNRYNRFGIIDLRSRIDRVYIHKKIARNTKINHVMVSFTDHYNVIFIDRFSSKTKIGKDSWYFNNSYLCKPEFTLTTETFLFLLKTQNTATLQQVSGRKTLNLF